MNYSVLTVTLNPALDTMLVVPGFKPGQTHEPQKVFTISGGKGINVSRVLQGLGVKQVPTGFAGGVNGQKLLRDLITEGMELQFVFIEEETRVNLTITDENGRVTRVLEQGPTVTQKDITSFRNRYARLVEGCQWVTISGRGVNGAPPDFYAELIRTAQNKGRKVALDSSKQDLTEGLKAKPFLLKLNQTEAEQLFRQKLIGKVSLKTALKKLLSKGVSQAVITLGSRGAVGTDGQGFWQVKAPKVKAVNAVGCGDSFLAGFLSASLEQRSFPESLKAGVAAGSLSAQNSIPGRIDKTKFASFCAKLRVIRLRK